MPIYRLSRALLFPPVTEAEPDGLLAVGGDLRPERLLLAYRSGIFPWYSADDPVLWWSPDPRYVLFPAELKVSASLRRVMRNGPFTVTMDREFAAVMHACGLVPRKGQDGTWITPAMEKAYGRLHAAGHAHSVEVWREGRLVGGLYGVQLGHVYFGESMFTLEPNASKVGFVHLMEHLKTTGVAMIDCQVHTQHLERFGARFIPRAEFLERLAAALAG